MRQVSWSSHVIRSAILLLGCLSIAFPCPFTGPRSHGYVHNGSCFSAVFSGLLPKMNASSNVLQVLDEYCQSLEPSARLANLLEGKQLQMPPPKYWFFHKNRLSFFAGTQVNPYQGKESNKQRGKNRMQLIKNTINISSQHVNVHVHKISSENAYGEGSLLCPVVIAKRNEPKYTIKFASCNSKPAWDIFFCKNAAIASTSSRTINSPNPQVEDTPPAAICKYDKEKRKCFLRLLESESNSLQRNGSRPCRCSSCTVDQWTKWGPWSSTCSHAERYRARAKDGETIGHCVDDQTVCCFEMEQKDLPECPATDQRVEVLNDCLNGGIPIDIGEGSIVCSCKRNFTGALCEKKRVRRTIRNLLHRLARKRYTKSDESTCMSSPCECRPCKNGGTCQGLGHGQYKCTCHDMFYGPLCESRKSKPCDQVKCQNGGHCVSDREKFICVCPGGYMGTLCETGVRPCVNQHSCLNGGTCQNNGTTDTCLCPTGFTGRNCGIYLLSQDCNAATCVNGDCIVTGGRVACQCKRGFHGMYCATQTNECLSMPCLNNGRCENVIGGFRCICPAEYAGYRCEDKVSPCASSPCIKGLCSRVGDGYMCSCYPGYEGNNCQRDINECLSEPCQNGGECEDQINSFKCYCPVGFSGTTCAFVELKEEKRSPWDTDYAMPLTILVVLLTIGVIGLIFYTYKEHVIALKKEATPEAQRDKSEEIEFSERSAGRRGTMQKVAEFLAALGWGKTEEQSESKDESDRQDKAKAASERSSQKQLGKSPKKERKGFTPPSGKRSPASSLRKGKSKKGEQKSPASSSSLSTPKDKGRSPASDRGRKSPLLSSRARKYIYTVPGYRSKKQKHSPARPLHLRIIRRSEPPKSLQSEGAEAPKGSSEEGMLKSKEGDQGSDRSSPIQKQSSLRDERKGNESPRDDRDEQRGSKRWWQFRLRK
ncbi:hypothetical protein M513_07608 [Trichuris suis]|uniref:EGF-like domain-containing protein n=1 Tax=Trichuris suis TaxID=68888 RepID=A0A085M2W2_9BILA|nr:hypothetical protein M513_07608 [Trichuris suis]